MKGRAMWTVLGMLIIVLLAIILLKGFDRLAGRGPQQVKDGIDQSRQDSHDPQRIPCPYCAEWILPDATICRYCHSKL